jgi:hypothetical protein
MPTRASRAWKERKAAESARLRSGIAFAGTRGREGVTMGGSTTGVRIEKENASQSEAYMRAAKALGYCMRCGCWRARDGGLDFCHADLGKGIGIKTDVRRGWPGCRRCHDIVGRELPRATRRAVEILLAAMTRGAILEAGTWPKNLPLWEQGEGSAACA